MFYYILTNVVLLLLVPASIFTLVVWIIDKMKPNNDSSFTIPIILAGIAFAIVSISITERNDKIKEKLIDTMTLQAENVIGESLQIESKIKKNTTIFNIDGKYKYLGKENLYEVWIENNEIKSITTGNEVVYRLLDDKK